MPPLSPLSPPRPLAARGLVSTLSPPASDKLPSVQGESVHHLPARPLPHRARPHCHSQPPGHTVPSGDFHGLHSLQAMPFAIPDLHLISSHSVPHPPQAALPTLAHLPSEPWLVLAGTQGAFPPTSPDSQVPPCHRALRPLPMPDPYRLGVTSCSEGPPGFTECPSHSAQSPWNPEQAWLPPLSGCLVHPQT